MTDAATVPITLHLSFEQYLFIAEVAEARGFETIAAMAQALMDALAGPDPARYSVPMLHERGLTDAEMCRVLDVTRAQIARMRKAHGLAANSPFRQMPDRNTQKETA